MDKYKRLLSDTLLFAVSNFSSKFLIFLLLPLYTGILTTAEYGYVDAIYTLISLGIPLVTLCIYEATLRFALDVESDKTQLFSTSLFVLLIGNALTLVCCIVYGIIAHETILRVILIFLLFFFNSVYLLLTQFIRGIQKVRIYAIGGIVLTLFTVIFNIFFLVILRLQVDGYILASICGYVVCIVFIVIEGKLSKYMNFKVDFELLREMLKYSAPMIPNTISWWINYSLDKYMVIYFCGVGENGLYSVASKFPAILTTVTDIFFKAWQISSAVEYNSEGRNSYYKKVYGVFLSVLIITSTSMMIFVKIFAKILLADDYFVSWKMMPFLIVAVAFSALSGFVGSICTAAKKTTILLKSTIIGAGVNILFNCLLIKTYGGVGAAIATAISFATIAFIRMYAVDEVRELHMVNIKVISAFLLLIVESIITYIDMWFGVKLIIIVLVLLLYKAEFLSIFNVIIRKQSNKRRK